MVFFILFFSYCLLSAVFIMDQNHHTPRRVHPERCWGLGCMKKDKGNRQGWEMHDDGKGAATGGSRHLGFVIKQKQWALLAMIPFPASITGFPPFCRF